MASSLDIAPALGHGLLTAQGQPGGYDAIDDRRQWGVGRQEGATSALAYKVTQKAEGANLSVDVATDEGSFLVQGDDVDHQGLYLVAPLASKTNLDLADTPDPSLPRVDQVVLEAIDDAHAFGGVTRARVYVLSGTPTAGADVVGSAAYESSKATLPASTARLAEFVVDAAATSIVDADIRDRRARATGLLEIIDGSHSGTSYSMSSGSSIEVDATRFTRRIETGGGPVVVEFDCQLSSGTAQDVTFDLYVDGNFGWGSNFGRGARKTITVPNTGAWPLVWRWQIPDLPAGNHEISLEWWRGGSGSIALANSSVTWPQMRIEERVI